MKAAARLREYLSTFCFDDYYFPMDGPFQNYTYFPSASLDEVRACWKKTVRLMRAGKAPRDLGIYIHWPFCAARCAFCFCSMKTPGSRKEVQRQLDALRREMDAFRGIFDKTLFTSLWIGGGTPTFMGDADLDALLGRVRDSFAFTEDAQIYVESSPATLTRTKADILARHGVNRITLGVQSRDAKVLRAAGRRGQSRAVVDRAFALAAERGLFIDLDLMFGLEGQSRVSFVRDLVWALKRRPQALHLYAFDPKPQTGYVRAGKRRLAGGRERLRILMEIADRLARGAGYRMSRLDPATLMPDCPEERQDSAVRRQGASVIGFGPSAISHAFGGAWYCHPLVGRGGRAGGIPPFRLLPSGLDEEMRGYALRNLALFGRIAVKNFYSRFGVEPLRARGVGGALQELAASGRLRVDRKSIVYAGRDPVERGITLKRLYSPRLLGALMRGRRREFTAYAKGRNGAAAIADKMEDRSLFRAYFRP
ncbi:MAG: radical SAM protein [Elusimicrobiota bacterium]